MSITVDALFEIRKQKEPKDTPPALDNMYLYLGCFVFSLFYFHKLVEIAYPLYTESFIGLGIYVDELAVEVKKAENEAAKV